MRENFPKCCYAYFSTLTKSYDIVYIVQLIKNLTYTTYPTITSYHITTVTVTQLIDLPSLLVLIYLS